MSVSGWKVISYVQIFYYAVAFLLAVHLGYVCHRFSKEKRLAPKGGLIGRFFYFFPFIFLFSLYCSFKVGGGICGVLLYGLNNASSNTLIGLSVASIVLDSVCLGFLLRIESFFLSYIDVSDRDVSDNNAEIVDDGYIYETYKHREDPEVDVDTLKGGSYSRARYLPGSIIYGLLKKAVTTVLEMQAKNKQSRESTIHQKKTNDGGPNNANNSKYAMPLLQRITAMLTRIAIILSAIGAGLSSQDTQDAKKVLIAASFLYLASALAALFLLVMKFTIYLKTKDSKDAEYSVGPVLYILFAVQVFLFLRIIYSLCGALKFHGYVFDGTINESDYKYTILLGDWKIYLGVGFIEECMVLLLFALLGELVANKRK
ncbi:hypothetical protein PACTADRAFT_32057 [Pachysolen tannophilus NRRL Y-2460]|uniref:DUF7702 domain-containing protein n=1 Tax=Pachysolen tannophilus NRRL Y-2460 TaxID=669874 RepID=A0A1E4TXP1_PACTA|nr:hypothetical protein PACTADRAFT_32057 [Pachysolen tannophilus NRRL Y-2460]